MCVPIASQILHGAGVAMAMKIRAEKRCSVTLIGDGGTSEGAFYEGINLAGARALPAVFIIVNNGWAISVPIEQQTATKTLAQKAIAAGIPGVQVDGNDVIAVRHIVGEATARARRGEGPTLIEALTYRLGDHTTADDASRYRDHNEVKEAWGKEPLLRLRAYLTKLRVWDDAREEALKTECAREVEAAVDEYLSGPKPTTDAMFDYLFANPPKDLAEQRETARRYAGGQHGGGNGAAHAPSGSGGNGSNEHGATHVHSGSSGHVSSEHGVTPAHSASGGHSANGHGAAHASSGSGGHTPGGHAKTGRGGH
jgi:pyruvate dehydrogenase E1 component alpha subunit